MGAFRKSGLRTGPGKGFWYSLYKREPMQPLQWMGLIILLLFFAALLVGLLCQVWPEGSAPWWQKLVHGYGVFAVIGAVIALAVVIPNAERRKGPLVALLFFLLGWLIFLICQHFPLFTGQ